MNVNDPDAQVVEESSPAENIMDAESDENASNRVPRDASHRNQISNTNSNFYKFGSQDQIQ